MHLILATGHFKICSLRTSSPSLTLILIYPRHTIGTYLVTDKNSRDFTFVVPIS